MSKFTQGPWFAARLEEGLFHVYGGIPEKLPIVVLDKRRDMHDGYRTIETPANAYLMAAAPEMYEALKGLLEQETYCDGLCNGSVEEQVASSNPDLMARVKSAILKAEGGTQ